MDILAYEQALIISRSVCTFILAAERYWARSNADRGEVFKGSGTDKRGLKEPTF